MTIACELLQRDIRLKLNRMTTAKWLPRTTLAIRFRQPREQKMRPEKTQPDLLFGAFFCALLMAFFNPDFALSQTPFYKGKTITFINGVGPGGTGDLRGKPIAAFLGRHIPGNPTIVTEYMPGAGGRKATNHIYSVARPDGLTIARISSSMVPNAVLGEAGV